MKHLILVILVLSAVTSIAWVIMLAGCSTAPLPAVQYAPHQ